MERRAEADGRTHERHIGVHYFRYDLFGMIKGQKHANMIVCSVIELGEDEMKSEKSAEVKCRGVGVC